MIFKMISRFASSSGACLNQNSKQSASPFAKNCASSFPSSIVFSWSKCVTKTSWICQVSHICFNSCTYASIVLAFCTIKYVQEVKHKCETWHVQEVFVPHLNHVKTIDDGKLIVQFLSKGNADCLESWFRHAPDDDANR